jgi:hypothetical protein
MRALFLSLSSAAVLLASCGGEEVRENRYERPGGGAALVERTTMGGGAAGYAYTEYELRFDGEEQAFPIAFVDHGDVDVVWKDGRTLELCFADEPRWAFAGVLRKGGRMLRIDDCRYASR